MRRVFIVILSVLFFVPEVTAQYCKVSANGWMDYSGKLGEKSIQLSFFVYPDSSITGNFRYNLSPEKVYSLKGNKNNCTLQLTVYADSGEKSGDLALRMYADRASRKDMLVGSFAMDNGVRQEVSTSLGSIVYGTPLQRYDVLFGSTGEVDSFAKKIRSAVLQKDKKWLASNSQYPLTVFLAPGKKKIIRNQTEFLNSFAVIFTTRYIKRFEKIPTYNLFSNHMGAMMGKGEVFINHSQVSTKEKYEYLISSFTVTDL